MMRKGAVVAALAVAIAAPAASGAVRSCRIVVDAIGDESPHDAVETPVDVPDVDVVSGDLASSATQMVAVVRLRGLADQPTPGMGAYYGLIFQMGERLLRAHTEVYGDGVVESELATFDVGPSNNTVTNTHVTPAKVVVDRTRDEVRMTFALQPLQSFGSIRRGAYVKILRIEASLAPGLSPVDVGAGERVPRAVGIGFDRGQEGPRTYRLGARSCVTVPR